MGIKEKKNFFFLLFFSPPANFFCCFFEERRGEERIHKGGNWKKERNERAESGRIKGTRDSMKCNVERKKERAGYIRKKAWLGLAMYVRMYVLYRTEKLKDER